MENKEVEFIYKSINPILEDNTNTLKDNLYNYLTYEYCNEDLRISDIEITTNLLKRRIIKLTLKDNAFNFLTNELDYETTLKNMFIYNVKRKKLEEETSEILFKIGDMFSDLQNLPKDISLDSAYFYLDLLKEFDQIIKEKSFKKENFLKLEELKRKASEFASKYNIEFTLPSSLPNKTLEEILTNTKTSSDYEYLAIASNYLEALSKKNESKKKYKIFIKQPISKKLEIAYTDFLYNRILTSNFSLNKKGSNELASLIEDEQEKSHKLQAIEEAILLNKVSKEDITFYLENVCNFKITEINYQDKYLRNSLKEKISYLTALKRNQKNEATLREIDFAINIIQDYYFALKYLNTSSLDEANALINVKRINVSNYLNSLKEGFYLNGKIDYANFSHLLKYQDYFSSFSKILQAKGYNISEIANFNEELNSFNYLVNIINNLQEPKFTSNIYDYNRLIESYFRAFKLLEDPNISKNEKLLLEKTLKSLEKFIPSDFTVKLKEDKLEIPKKYFKK